MNTKNLHKHSLPIIVLAAIVLTLSVTSLRYHPISRPGIFARALFGHALTVKPSKNGLAHLEINRQPVGAEVKVAPEKPTLVPAAIINNSGESAKLQILLKS